MERQTLFLVTGSLVVLLMTRLKLTVVAADSVDGRYSFVMNASRSSPQAEYDYIIVGGGAAGCPLAATLSQKYRVLLLERGGAPFEKRDVTNASNFWEVLSNIDDASVSPAQTCQSLDGVMNRAGRRLVREHGLLQQSRSRMDRQEEYEVESSESIVRMGGGSSGFVSCSGPLTESGER